MIIKRKLFSNEYRTFEEKLNRTYKNTKLAEDIMSPLFVGSVAGLVSPKQKKIGGFLIGSAVGLAGHKLRRKLINADKIEKEEKQKIIEERNKLIEKRDNILNKSTWSKLSKKDKSRVFNLNDKIRDIEDDRDLIKKIMKKTSILDLSN